MLALQVFWLGSNYVKHEKNRHTWGLWLKQNQSSFSKWRSWEKTRKKAAVWYHKFNVQNVFTLYITVFFSSVCMLCYKNAVGSVLKNWFIVLCTVITLILSVHLKWCLNLTMSAPFHTQLFFTDLLICISASLGLFGTS